MKLDEGREQKPQQRSAPQPTRHFQSSFYESNVCISLFATVDVLVLDHAIVSRVRILKPSILNRGLNAPAVPRTLGSSLRGFFSLNCTKERNCLFVLIFERHLY